MEYFAHLTGWHQIDNPFILVASVLFVLGVVTRSTRLAEVRERIKKQ